MLPPLRKFLASHGKSIFRCPCTQFVWLIVGNWWTILLWSGSTRGWSRAASAILLICTEVFLWLTHQKLDYPENFWCNVRNWGGIAPLPPIGYAPGYNCSGRWIGEYNKEQLFWAFQFLSAAMWARFLTLKRTVESENRFGRGRSGWIACAGHVFV